MFKDLKAETDRQCVILSATVAIAANRITNYVEELVGDGT